MGKFLLFLKGSAVAGTYLLSFSLLLIAGNEVICERETSAAIPLTRMNPDAAINYAHLAGIVSTSLQGALLTYGLIKPPQIQLLDVFSSVISATGTAAGKVVFGWLGR